MAKKILIVDDNPGVVKLLSERLKANGYEVVEAHDGLHALEEVLPEKPDLIITDIRMPAGDGITIGQILQMSDNTASIPMIFITAYPNDEIKEKAMKMGAKYFVTKPFKADDLLNKVKEVLGESKPDDKP